MDVVDDFRRRRGGQGQYGSLGDIGTDVGNLQVGRSEVVAPLRDAVRLVDGQQTDFHLLQCLDEGIGLQAFRRDIKELQSTVSGLVVGQLQCIGVHARIDGCRRDAFVDEVRHLVFHQRNEGRDDDAEAVHGHRRHLETDALAATRRQQRERVVPSHHRVDDVLLQRAEAGIAPILLQYGTGDGGHTISISRFRFAIGTSRRGTSQH